MVTKSALAAKVVLLNAAVVALVAAYASERGKRVSAEAQNLDLSRQLAVAQNQPAPEEDLTDIGNDVDAALAQAQAALNPPADTSPAPSAPTGGDTSTPEPTPAPETSAIADTPSTPPSGTPQASDTPVVTDEAQTSGDTASA